MTFNLDVDYVVSDTDRAGPIASDNRSITDFLVRSAITARYKDGVRDRAVQRLVARVQNALVRAVKDDQDLVELTDEQLRFVLDTLKDWQVPAGLLAWHGDLLDEVELSVRELDDAKRVARNGTEPAASEKVRS